MLYGDAITGVHYGQGRSQVVMSIFIGTLHHASTQPPPSSDVSLLLYAEMQRRGPT